MHDQPATILLLHILLGSVPLLSDHVNGLSVFGEQLRHIPAIRSDPASRRGRIFTANDQMFHARDRSVESGARHSWGSSARRAPLEPRLSVSCPLGDGWHSATSQGTFMRDLG